MAAHPNPRSIERVIVLEALPDTNLGIDLRVKMNSEGKNIGAVVNEVKPDSLAARAGLKKFDFISAIGDQSVINTPLERIIEIFHSKRGRFEITVQGDTWFFMQSSCDKFSKIRKKLYSRQYVLSSDFRKIRWESQSKQPRDSFIYTNSIKRIDRGISPSMRAAIQELTPADAEKVLGQERRCFTIVFAEDGEGYHELHLMAASQIICDTWCTGLEFFCQKSAGSKSLPLQLAASACDIDNLVTDLFEYGSNQSNRISKDQCKMLLHYLNSNMSSRRFEEKFREAAIKGRSYLQMEEFTRFFQLIRSFNELTDIKTEYFNADGTMSLQKLATFLQKEQRIIFTESECVALIQRFEREQIHRQHRRLSLEGLSRFLMSEDGDAWNRTLYSTVYQDMSQPLTHYFISSSHNTYLVDHQLFGQSAVEMYARAFQLGCKCVELDCWDGEDGEPIIYHGHTLTTKISFKAVIQCVAANAFIVSDYPVILSLEVHTSVPQQVLMAKYITEILGDMVKVPFDSARKHMPSPEELRGKVLIKGKKLGQPKDLNSGAQNEEDEVSDEDEAAEALSSTDGKGEDAKVTDTVRKKIRKMKASQEAKPHNKIKLAKELSDLVTWIRGVHFKDFHESYDDQDCDNIVSFSELKASGFLSDIESALKFVNRNKKQMTRTYPAGFRVNSTNYDPVIMWSGGAQVVALNFQTASHEMNLNQGFFRNNGQSGYVLKPSFLRDPAIMFNPIDPTTFDKTKAINLKIKIIGANFLPKPRGVARGEIIDPYVVVKIHGVSSDEKEVQTETEVDNGFDPHWNAEMNFSIAVPELALVHIVVYDKDVSMDDFIGQAVVPLSCLNTGYRRFHLHYMDHRPIRHASVFAHITMTPQGAQGAAASETHHSRV